mmetsp:Transcript_10769/g.28790  ORF Transcript_10769/g.28790 Transcript_10769/m.28790 type:complete len:318 (+) Transcript_10769:97-1050(+)
MLRLTQDPVSAGLRQPSVQHFSRNCGESTKLQQPEVITIRSQTDSEMITEMLKKLQVRAPSHHIAGGVNPNKFGPSASAVAGMCTSADLAGMARKAFTQVSPQTLHHGISPPPGLSLCEPPPRHVTAGLLQKDDAHSYSVQDVYGFSKAAQDEQSSTNDDGEHAACESLPSEDDVAHAHTFHSPALGRGMTTLMVRNVPVMYTQRLLLKEWENEGAYDFLYLPMSSVEQKNLSFAFINFASEAHAMAFKQKWHKKRMARFTARKPLNISFADVQGLRANVLQVTRRRVASSEAPRQQPYIFINGKCMDPQEALTAIR